MSAGPANRSAETLAYIRKHFSLDGDTVLRDGRPIRHRPSAAKAKYRKVHIRCIGGRQITWNLSRLKFYLATGGLPEVVDHKSGVTRDDALTNLRAATIAQNNQNRRANLDKLGGLPRAIEQLPSGRFRARFGYAEKKMPVGTFDSLEEAVEARNAAEKPLKGEFHRPRTRRKTSTATQRARTGTCRFQMKSGGRSVRV